MPEAVSDYNAIVGILGAVKLVNPLSGTTAKVIAGFEATITTTASNIIIFLFMRFTCP